jgi:hypothetical protein
VSDQRPPAGADPAPGSIRCPRCGSTVGPTQDWCLDCGAAARTRLASVPNWRLPVAVLSAVAALATVALVIAFVALTGSDDPVQGTEPSPTAPAAAAPPVETTPTPTPEPATTVPPGTTVPLTTVTTPEAIPPAGTPPAAEGVAPGTVVPPTTGTVTVPPAVTAPGGD